MPDETLPVEESRSPIVTAGVRWLLTGVVGAQFLQWTLVQPEEFRALVAFQRSDLDSGRWWTAATYSLIHSSVTLLALTVYALLVFGPRLERSWGTRRFVGFAALAALGGWIVHLFIGGTAPLVGGSAIAFGVMGAYALRWGGEERLFPGGFSARERWAVAFTVAITLLTGLQETVGGGVPFLAHLGGLGAAWVFSRAGNVLLVERIREGVSALPDEPSEEQPPRAVPRTLPRTRAQRETIDDVVARTNAETVRKSAPTRRRPEPKTIEQQEAADPTIDAILDKISAEGMDHLTPDECRVLDDHSRRLRDK